MKLKFLLSSSIQRVKKGKHLSYIRIYLVKYFIQNGTTNDVCFNCLENPCLFLKMFL